MQNKNNKLFLKKSSLFLCWRKNIELCFKNNRLFSLNSADLCYKAMRAALFWHEIHYEKFGKHF